MIIKWAENAWNDYIYWQNIDKKITKKINELIKDIIRHPFDGLGYPEPLKHNWSGFWSRRINKEHRLVYSMEDNEIFIAQCRFHY
ncbi:Txe/YoeB family addiction module toxin [Geminocystis sp. GBBB08]|uniref:Txe/YoeB family addiction module toxin n=1 Tax=Geminocystis sp. GBBB08 TaxID=2604140 RepID=UPI0027E2CA88|nr:Txe/YoeB family addiction module toxin [Geminocystis sp. GBBB08]MBL1210962.1 Txe/YoeB family addiction module toxin [Geminocystis sp. GBBB08]